MSLRRRWVVASGWGWIVGFAVTVALAVALDTVGVRGQFVVGLGMGLGLGLGQGRVVRTWNVRARRWLLATALGLGGAFLLGDVLAGFGVPYSLVPYALLGALTASLLQAKDLDLDGAARARWVGGSMAAWTLAGLVVLASDATEGPASLLLLAVALLGGGFLLGAVTSLVLPPLDHD